MNKYADWAYWLGQCGAWIAHEGFLFAEAPGIAALVITSESRCLPNYYWDFKPARDVMFA